MDLPTIVAALIEHDLEAAVVARASAGFPVALANEAARFRAPQAKVGEPLGSWIGDEAARASFGSWRPAAPPVA